MNSILRPTRLYELKDESIIEFGAVHAIYRKYRSINDTMIPETPAPSRQKITDKIIPNTPDSSLNNSSGVDDDGSVILGTQKEENSVFRQPRVPQQRQSTSIDKKRISCSSSVSENSQTTTVLHTSDINVSQNQVSIYDVETQNIEKQHEIAERSIHDIETQILPIDTPEYLVKANTKTNKQLSRLNTRDKTAGSSTDIYDIETQNCMDDISEMETQKSQIDIQNVTRKKFMDIHNIETQDCASIDEDGSGNQKSKIDENKCREKDLAEVRRNIHNLETQIYDNESNAEDISDLETQFTLDNITGCKESRYISEIETQLETDGIANKISNAQANEDIDKGDVTNIIEDETSHENITRLSKSRSTSPGYLNLSSPGIDENYPCSPLNQSVHLLESSDLLRFFGEDIDKQEVQASNASTPKLLTKILSKNDSNAENASNASNNEENDEDVFNAPTQRTKHNFEALLSDSETDEENALVMSKSPPKKRKEPLLQQINDSETNAEEYLAELAKKQHESSETANKSYNESNRNDLGTSVESEDMFEALTQKLNNPMITNISNSLINQPKEINKNNETVDTASMQIKNNRITKQQTTADQNNETTNAPPPDINDVAPTQSILSRETSPEIPISSKVSSSKNDQNSMDDKAATQIINVKSVDCHTSENLDCEDIDYELAPTQVIGEVEDRNERNSIHEKTKKDSSKINMNDTLEQKLNEMFDDINNEVNNTDELPMSTQYLTNILESSQCLDSTNKSIVDDGGNVSLKLGRKDRVSRSQRLHNTKTSINNVNSADSDSQKSDIYFSTITTKRKRNILKDTQELVDSAKDIALPRQDANSNEKAMDNTTESNITKSGVLSNATESNKRRKRISKMKNKSDVVTEALNDNKNKVISSRSNERNLRSSNSMKQEDEILSERNNKVLDRDSAKCNVDDAKENSSSCIPCPLENGQRAQTLHALDESDDDILTRLPAVRISGTLSNPASPSALSTSSGSSSRSKKVLRSKRRKISLKRKSLHEQNIRNSEKNDKPVDSHSSNSIPNTPKTAKISNFADTSDDSDSETNIMIDKRFQQMANRILNNEFDCQQIKENKNSTRSSFDLLENPKQSTVGTKNSARINSKITRQSSRQDDQNSRLLQRETRTRNAPGNSVELEMKSIVAKRKTSLNMTEKGTEQAISKKRKTSQVIEKYSVSTRSRKNTAKTTAKQSSILEDFTETNTRGNCPMIENMKSSEDDKTASKTVSEETSKTSVSMRADVNINPIIRVKRIINNNRATCIDNVTVEGNNKKKSVQEKKIIETETDQVQGKVLRVLLRPIQSSTDDESQEVERIMAKGPSNAQDKNLSIRENSSAKIFQKKLRTRSSKRPNESNSANSSVSSEAADSDNSAPKAKRGRLAKNLVSLSPEISKKKEIFKKPSRINRNSPILNSSAENTIDENSQRSTESDVSTSSRISRSKTMGIGKKEKMKINQNNSIDYDASLKLNISVEMSPVSTSSRTPSRMRRSTSVLSNFSPSATKHKILFTGITEDYSKIIKMLGGSKVDDPANCTVLVTDKVRRTYKFLCALAKGIPIVTIDWLNDSETAAQFLNWENYILKDPVAEAKFGFRLRKSLDKVKEKRLLDGYTIVLTSGLTLPPIKELKDMITSCGGKALLRPPAKWPEKTVVISCEEDLPNARKFLAKAPKTVTVQSTEFILTGILRQETEFNKYKFM
ncbi:hypothetical protein P5V15_013377 [Pogonomyrmex californicus]